jgi:FkbM family methyltransferase
MVLTQILNRTPFSILRFIEDKVQSHLGKGWGAGTTHEEAKAIAYFAKKLKILKVLALDVGANLGNWSADLLDEIPSAEVIVFEPSKEAFEHLRDRFSGKTSIQCANVALGKENATVTLFADKSASGLGSLTKRRVGHFGIDFSYQENIQLFTLDTWLENNGNGRQPNILKMDVEGHELDVLKGATKALVNISIIQFEFGGSNIDTRTYFQDFWYFFSDLGFDLYRLGPRKPLRITNYSEHDETFRPTNYIAVRK